MDFRQWYGELIAAAVRMGRGADYVKNCGGAREWRSWWQLQYAPDEALQEYAELW